jgi:hypothetical protein
VFIPSQHPLPNTEAGLPIPPKAPSNAYTIFASEYFAANRDKLQAAVSSSGIGAVGKELRERWTTMSEEDKADYQARGKKLREQYLKDFTKFLNVLQPGQLDAIETILGKKILFPGGRKNRAQEQRDASGDMAKPLSPYFLFYRELHQKGELPATWATDGRDSTAKNARFAAAKWKEMSDEEKEVSPAVTVKMIVRRDDPPAWADLKPWVTRAAEYRAKYNEWKAEHGL